MTPTTTSASDDDAKKIEAAAKLYARTYPRPGEIQFGPVMFSLAEAEKEIERILE